MVSSALTWSQTPQRSFLASRSALPFDYFPGIFPECMEQTDRVNNWKGGETQGLSNLKKRLDIEEMVR